jgi:HAD superfamily hydrolase (TIGR01662 family)
MNKELPNWAVLFDLDETLVLTSALESLRKARRWKDVYSAFDQTRLPRGTRSFLEKLAERAQIGVVTKAPRSYAEKLLVHHTIQMPVIVAYHDVKRVKPDPEALLLASKRLRVEPARCIYVGDDGNDVQAARSAGFAPIGVCWGGTLDIGIEPICKSWDDVYDEIIGLIAE